VLVLGGVTFTAVANGATPETDEWEVGAGGSANADSATALAACINAATARCLCTASAASAVVTITSTLNGDDPRSIAMSRTGAPLTLSGTYLPAPWALLDDAEETVTAASVRRQAFPALPVPAPRGRLAAIPDTVALSAGGLTWYLAAVNAAGDAI
jgi:hypothetical protein